MAGETFQLRFANNENLTVSIDEPINFATVDFQLSQKEKGYGRDISFNGGEIQFEFVKYRNHYLDKLLEYNNTYGFESIVELLITTTSSTASLIGELDFATAITDDLEYFKCKVIQKASVQIVKRRKAVKVDLLSDKDIDGKTITPLVPVNMVMIAKPITENSRWKSEATGYITAVSSGGSGVTNYKNYCTELYDYSIPTSYSPSNTGADDGTRILTATNELNNIVINISSHTLIGKLVNAGGFWGSGSGDAIHYFGYRYGTTFSNAATVLTEVRFLGTEFSIDIGNSTRTYTKSFTATIANLPQGHSVWLYHSCYVRHAGGGHSELQLKQSAMNIEVIASTTSVNSVVLSFRLIDVMRQVVNSISGLSILAPRFDTSGDFYNNRLVNGNFLRKITEVTEIIDDGVNQLSTKVKKPFSISLEDLEKSLVELNVDWEIDKDGNIFFGTEDDFYKEDELKVFSNVQFSSFNKSFNPRFQINEFNYGYKKFQTQKENEILNSYDVVNGESKWVLQNKNVENKKDISIEWIRDSFLIEESRRKAIELSSSTSSQDDDTLFIIDSQNTVYTAYTNSITFTHQYNGEDEHLILVSAGTTPIDLSLLPITVGDKFTIKPVSPSTTALNKGDYFVINITSTTLTLKRTTDIITNTTPTSTAYTWSYIDATGTPTVGTPAGTATDLLHNFTSTGIYPETIQRLRLTKSTPFTPSHSIGDLLVITTAEDIGNYEITYVNSTYIELKRTGETSPSNPLSVSFTYGLNPTTNPFTSYTSANFNFGTYNTLIGQDKFANLRYSIKRNIHNYWRKYLATCNLYHRTEPIKNTWYKNNKFFVSTYNTIKLTEGYDIETAFYNTDDKLNCTPNLSPYIYNDVIFSNVEYSDYVTLQDNIRSRRGYVKTYDNNGYPILLYPISMKYENLSKELTIKAEEKFTSTFVPTVVTSPIIDITSKTMISGGSILSNGYLGITAKGIVWGTISNPTIDLATKTTNGTGDNSFISNASLLTPNTLYYVRAYATNLVGTGYGAEISFTTSIGDYLPTDYLSTDYSVTI